MRVVVLSKAFVRGAYQRKLEELARLPDVELTLITPAGWTDGGHYVKLERRYTEGYEMVVAPMWLDGHFHVHFYPTLGRILGHLQPEIVHVDEEPYNLATFHAIVAARRLGAKTLFFTWQNILRTLPPPFGWIERYNYANADHAIAGSRDASDILRQKGYRGPISIVPQFGVDPELFYPRPEPVTADAAGESGRESRHRPFTIGYVGRLVEAKGLLDLLSAVAGLEGEWRLELIGDGPLRGELERRAREMGIEARVRLWPTVPSTEIPAALRQFDAVVLPSIGTPSWKEQFGRVLVEAMACAVPVVGSDSGEIPHVIGEAGLVFPEGKPDELRARLAGLAADATKRRTLGKLGRDRVLREYTQARIAEATYRIYGELSAARVGTPAR